MYKKVCEDTAQNKQHLVKPPSRRNTHHMQPFFYHNRLGYKQRGKLTKNKAKIDQTYRFTQKAFSLLPEKQGLTSQNHN